MKSGWLNLLYQNINVLPEKQKNTWRYSTLHEMVEEEIKKIAEKYGTDTKIITKLKLKV